MGMTRDTVNHSEGFKNLQTGAHTNTIEGNWRGIKVQIPTQHYNATFISGGLDEAVWRRDCRGAEWESFINALKTNKYT